MAAAATTATRVIVVSGPPGSGKGTQCERLNASHGFIHVSTGDIVRAAVRDGTSELGRKARAFIENGDLLPDGMVMQIVVDALQSDEARQHGVVLDGFPRNEQQARALLRNESIEVVRFILLDVNDDVCVQRILQRYVDPTTGRVYNTEHMPAPADDVALHARLIRRTFDHDERVIRNRMAHFRAMLGNILPLFAGHIQVVNGAAKPTEVEVAIAHCMFTVVNSAASAKAAPPSLPPTSKAAAATAADKLPKCTICVDSDADHLVVPCGHQCGCLACLTRIQQTDGKCPICRTNIQSLLKVFRVGFDNDDDELVEVDDAKTAATASIINNNNSGWEDDVGDHHDDDDEKGANAAPCVSLSVAPCYAMRAGERVDVAIGVHVPDLTVRLPIDVVCVVDISGSMSSMASYQDGDGVRNDGMNILDLVKRAVVTVSHILNHDDRLGVVAFDNVSEVAYALNFMTDAERERVVTDGLSHLRPRNGTNIWEGLRGGLEALRQAPEVRGAPHRGKFVMLLTDGRPVTSPPRGHVAELEMYKESNPDFSFQINTFGFGYSLDSELLHDLATHGRGAFAFIPDAKLLGTCFVNSVANAACGYAQHADVHVMLKNGSAFVDGVESLANGIPDKVTSWGRVLNVGPLQLGETHEFVVRITAPPELNGDAAYLEVVVDVRHPDGTVTKVSTLATATVPTDESIGAYARLEAVNVGMKALDAADHKRGNKAIEMMNTLVGFVTTVSVATPSESLTALLADVGGRMLKAFQTAERWKRWGRHFVRALVRAHQLKQSTNFMDAGLQLYGGTLFRQLRDDGGNVFMTLPPPAAARAVQQQQQQQQRGGSGGKGRRQQQQQQQVVAPPVPAPAAVNMQTYYEGGGGGCFGKECSVVVMVAGERTASSTMSIANIHKGQRVQVAGGAFVEVLCVAQMNRPRAKPLMMLSGGLVVTPGHPVMLNGKWTLPRHVATAREVPNVDGVVYNLVLPPGNVLLVNGVPCVTWGHQLHDTQLHAINPRRNAYFGGAGILDDIANGRRVNAL